MRKGEQTKANIIAKAADILNQKGYYASSLSEIMEATGLKKGGIYNHFGSKEEIVTEVFHYCVNKLDAHFQQAVSRHSHAADQLLALIDAAKDLYHGRPVPGGCPIMNAAVESDDAYPFLKEKANQSMNRLLARIASIIKRGQRTGDIRTAVDAREVAVFVVSTIEGALMLSKLRDEERPLRTAISSLTQYINQFVRNS
ncbi:TetR/AcrR family transcriptional regulator [Xylanibacillus composti]|uniref:TetR family transcriptional regulator n=1 Tax=Xylanibacillus composti TaxID=1572762 RepID=A0A8J4H0P2_9BACL|nr:TetR/AcrR family transcriptional regulator [Xylanibacillus composti]GIQ68729.1 TetR family transcriptional regulator [Xylanibacillus composti]